MGDSSGLRSGYKEYVAGMLAGVATVIVKLQKHNTGANGMMYKSGLHCTAAILKTDGVKGLYRGATPSFVGMAFESSLAFGIYSQTKQLLQGETKNEKPQPLAILPSAAFAGAVISFILCPSELVKLFRADRISPQLTGLFRGGGATLLRESIGNAVFFSTYEHVRYYMRLPLRDASSDLAHFTDVGIGIVSGGLSGIAIYRGSGIRGCYTGLGPTIVRAFPANAAAIVTWELAMKMLGIKRE
ncbi:hypothetical protein DH2020_041888 [Rehmannia glutinosa]|uniref:Mitochondrial carrier protein n=1 Tax=Rehmannia glutinosa TaxID=99300 RepID=A0ABR0UR25_REHGL